MKAMLLAAGRGERLRPLTDEVPKPLLEVEGVTLIERHICRLRDAGVTDLVINVSHLRDKIMDRLGDGKSLGVSITWSIEAEALETGGGIKKALPLLGRGPFLVVSTDTYHDVEFEQIDASLTDKALGCLVMTENPPHHPAGDFAIDEEGVLRHEGNCLTYAGVGLFRPELVAGVADQSFALRRVFDEAISSGLMLGTRYEGYWCDVGTIERYDELKRDMASR